MQLIKKTIQKGVFETISIGEHPFELKKLSNGVLISNNYKSVTLFNQSFNQLKKIDIYAFGCAIHNGTDIYIADHHNHCILLMDNQLNIIKKLVPKVQAWVNLIILV